MSKKSGYAVQLTTTVIGPLIMFLVAHSSMHAKFDFDPLVERKLNQGGNHLDGVLLSEIQEGWGTNVILLLPLV